MRRWHVPILSLFYFLAIALTGLGPLPRLMEAAAPAVRVAALPDSELGRLREEGIAAYRQGDLATAEQRFRAGLAKAEAASDDGWATRFLNNLGIVYKDQERFDKALEAYTHALSLYEDHAGQRGLPPAHSPQEQQELARLHSNLGVVYFHLGEYQKAVICYARARQLLEAPGSRGTAAPPQATENREALAAIFLNLGNVYNSLGQWGKALACFDRTGQLRRAGGLQGDDPVTLNNQANAYQGLENWAKARGCLERALQLDETGGTRPDLAATLSNLGNVCARLGANDEALAYHARARDLRQMLGNPRDLAVSLINLGAVYAAMRQWEKASEAYAGALKLLEPLATPPDMGVLYANRGSLAEQQGQLEAAEADYARAIHSFEAESAEVGDPSQVGAFQQANQRDLYARYAGVLDRRGHPAAALAAMEEGRAQGLARQVALSPVDFSRVLSKEDAAALQARTTALTAAGKQLVTALRLLVLDDPESQRALQAERESARRQVDTAASQLSVLRDSLIARSPAFRQIQGRQSPSPQQLTDLARRHPDTIFLEWAVTDDRSTLLFALSQQGGLKRFTLPLNRAILRELVTKWLLRLTASAPDEPEHAAKLYAALLAPVEKAGLLEPQQYKHLVLVPDGPLLNLPWAALRDASGKRLIDRISLATSVSLGVLTWPPNPRSPQRPLLCAADPVGAGSAPLQVATRGDLRSLKHARAEAAAVARLFPGAVSLVGTAAREATVRQQIGRCALLHFATHAVADPLDGLLSWLLLAPEPLTSPEDGRLEAREVVGLPLSARLAVLSACQTGLGQAGGGEGLLGLVWAFHAAGCPSVVSSLWSVDDAATGKMMAAFYRELKAGQRKDEALRAAMLAVRKNPAHARPYYWAPFQVSGDTSPIGRS